MNFQSTEYLKELNLDLDGVLQSTYSDSTSTSPNDLDLFSHSDFFDLDVFSEGHVVPNKPQLNQEVYSAHQSPELDQQHQYTEVKQEEKDLDLNLLNIPLEVSSSNFTLPDATNEDKRKRNTAASARFRIKKKLKEQQMEQKAKELQDKVFALEKKLKTLEMENKCLKNLILQKNERKNSELLENIKKKSIVDSSPGFQFTT